MSLLFRCPICHRFYKIESLKDNQGITDYGDVLPIEHGTIKCLCGATSFYSKNVSDTPEFVLQALFRVKG